MHVKIFKKTIYVYDSSDRMMSVQFAIQIISLSSNKVVRGDYSITFSCHTPFGCKGAGDLG